MYRLHFRRQSVNIRVKGESRCDERPYHHDSICRLEDIHVILDSFQIFNFAYDFDMPTSATKDLANLFNVALFAHK
jgi:hypothetical protein